MDITSTARDTNSAFISPIYIQECFNLSESDDIKNYLYSTETLSYAGSVADFVKVKFNRLTHYASTGKWINETSCLNFCVDKNIYKQVDIQQLFNKTVAQQFPEFQMQAGPLFNPPSILEKLAEKLSFFVQFIRSPSVIGSVFPSSARLIASMCRQIPDFDANDKPRRILEIGAGTGPITEGIIRKMKANDQLVLVEFEPALCDILRDKFGGMKNVTIYEGSILDFTSAEKFDVTISALPLTSFTSTLAAGSLEKYKELTKEGGYVSYVELMGLAKIKQCFVSAQASADMNRIFEMKQSFVDTYEQESDTVWLNITPAKVHHCKMETIALEESHNEITVVNQ
jgi:phospholipid N-methyltransferase